ncbi:hypothetical protein KKB40_01145 [Patescibacteria group bacterium]|nr:hypothetical protein [Patescibacteria group bacterium]
MPETLHLHKSQKYSRHNVVWLLVPILIFGVVLAAYIFSKTVSINSERIAISSDDSFVLGESDGLDNTKANLLK